MAHRYGCSKCYQTDKFGQIEKFLCSRFGWDGSRVPCHCAHHDGEVSLYGRAIVERVEKEMAA